MKYLIAITFIVLLSIGIVLYKSKKKEKETIRVITTKVSDKVRLKKSEEVQTHEVNKQKKITLSEFSSSNNIKDSRLRVIFYNFDKLYGTDPELKEILKSVKSLKQTATYETLQELQNIIVDSGISEQKRQYFIQLASELNISQQEKLRFIKKIARHFDFSKKYFNNKQELYTAEIALKSFKTKLKGENEKKLFNEMLSNLKNRTLKNLLR